MHVKRRVYFSKSTDPYVNLSLEDQLFRNERQAVLFMYVNSPCVVMGRHQNPWLECDMRALGRDTVPLLRRQSGGGAVYHDTGNLNWCFITPRENYDPDTHFSIILDSLIQAGIPAGLSARKDLFVDGRKISGSAYKIGKERCLHHGTMLIDADLDKLTAYLQAPDRQLASKGIDSVRSRVANLTEFQPRLAINDAVEMLADAYMRHSNMDGSNGNYVSADESSVIQQLSDADLTSTGLEYSQSLREWSWLFGKTPDFTHSIKFMYEGTEAELVLSVHRGCIQSLQLSTGTLDVQTLAETLAEAFSRLPYEPAALGNALAENLQIPVGFREILAEVINKEIECL
ncbi:lipoate--protein ligase [Spirochaeta dissipatitropha]